jgi:hypothetical protein
MKRIVFVAACAAIVSGCAAPTPKTVTSAGKGVFFESPILSKDELNNATFVLLEKSIADGKYRLVSVSKQRQPVTNTRQERIAFSGDASHYAPDYEDRNFQTYTDQMNYGQQTVIYVCDDAHRALANQELATYTVCNSSFAKLFMPMGIEKNYAMGHLNAGTYHSYEDPRVNLMRIVVSPRAALEQAGVMQNFAQIESAK